MHMKLSLKGTNGIDASGEGTLQLSPKNASKFVVSAQAGVLGKVSVEILSIDGKQYTRLGSGQYDEKDDSSSSKNGAWADGKNPKLIDEPKIGGKKAWHVKATDSSGDAYELWVREDDGYPLKYQSDGSSALTSEFSNFNGESTITPPPSSEVKPPAKDLKGAVGEAFALNGVTVTVAQVQKNFVADNPYEKPKAGNTWVAVEFLYVNTGTDKVSYNPFDWKMKDDSGAEYSTAFASKEPALHSGDLATGEKARGWVVYEVPTGASGLTLKGTFGGDTAMVAIP